MQQISLLKKITTCFIAGLTASFALQRIIYRTIWEFSNKWIPPPVFIAIPILLVLLFVIIYSFYWHQQERKKQRQTTGTLTFWQGIIRFSITLDLSMIGWQKIFHLQFHTPLAILDQPFSSFSGEALTWAYFGHSYAFTCVVGLLQIAGAYLLLFKRISLFGCFILFPVLLNIVCIDFFYNLEAGELGHAVILLMGVVYLLLQDYNRLVEFFFRAKKNLINVDLKNRFIANALRLLVIAIPLLLILSYSSPDKNPQLTGKYAATNTFINQKPVMVKSCIDSILTTVYFDKENDIVFDFNSQLRRLIGSYQFNQQNNHFNIAWRYPANQPGFDGTLSMTKENQIMLSGKIGADSLQAILVKGK
ncbi:MAG: hypothetical protein QM726_11090 [Chitinophagaceae bacterium]